MEGSRMWVPSYLPVLLQLHIPYQLHFHSLPFIDSSKHSIITQRMLFSDSLSLKGMHFGSKISLL